MTNKNFYLKNFILFLTIFLLFFSFSCKKSKPGDDRRVTPLEKPLAKVGEKYGIKFEDYLIPETISLPAGQFMMGSDQEEEIPKEEQPPSRVVILGGDTIGKKKPKKKTHPAIVLHLKLLK